MYCRRVSGRGRAPLYSYSYFLLDNWWLEPAIRRILRISKILWLKASTPDTTMLIGPSTWQSLL